MLTFFIGFIMVSLFILQSKLDEADKEEFDDVVRDDGDDSDRDYKTVPAMSK